ncbi:MAG: hypothetical protein JO043_08620 [Candidatus Eremiobacteraeota bacterium]|nr:hypothetical protein [Candidatus Eremiobacteraeota bacterium]
MKAWAPFATGVFLAFFSMAASASATMPSASARSSVPADWPGAANLVAERVQAKLERLMLFTPDRKLDVIDGVARSLQRQFGGHVHEYVTFLHARLRDFQAIVAHYDMRPNDLSTARAFAIVAGYKAYNGDHLTDSTSGSIFRTMLALQTAAPQWYEPWSDARKQSLYVTWALQGSVLNWLDDEARKDGDATQQAAVRTQARSFLQRQLGRNPDTVKLDRFACVLYRDEDCPSLIRHLRAEFQVALR